MDESKFNINFVREVFLIGPPAGVEVIRKTLKPYYFLQVKTVTGLEVLSGESHFIVAIVDFTSPQQMQAAAQIFAKTESPLAYRLIYVTAPPELNREQLLYAQEIGARFVCSGPGKNDELKERLKRICSEVHQVGSMLNYEHDLHECLQAKDVAGALRLLERLRALPGESEDSLRLLCEASAFVKDTKRFEAYLKRLLALNPQNLWAANTLGKFYLSSGRAAAGMEVLSKLSQFHELNSERLLLLGDAQATAGRSSEAEVTLKTSAGLVGADDPRVQEGLAKVKLSQQDLSGALNILGEREFSPEMISFLNMRAIMAIRAGKSTEGIDYYAYAARGAGANQLVKAKVLFNMGIGYVRLGDLDKAAEVLGESCRLGGRSFTRAKGPLDKVVQVLKTQGKSKKVSPDDQAKLQEVSGEAEWESLF